MSSTTGVVLATGGLTMLNTTVFNGQPLDWRVPIATGVAAVGFSLAERAWKDGAVILAWSAFLTVLLTRVNSKVPSPVETAARVLNYGGK
jgi:hypothetical protein